MYVKDENDEFITDENDELIDDYKIEYRKLSIKVKESDVPIQTVTDGKLLCPYCGHIFSTDEEIYWLGSQRTYPTYTRYDCPCPECNKIFEAARFVNVYSYEGTPIK